MNRCSPLATIGKRARQEDSAPRVAHTSKRDSVYNLLVSGKQALGAYGPFVASLPSSCDHRHNICRFEDNQASGLSSKNGDRAFFTTMRVVGECSPSMARLKVRSELAKLSNAFQTRLHETTSKLATMLPSPSRTQKRQELLQFPPTSGTQKGYNYFRFNPI